MTPAPMTPSRFGTASNSSAPQESTICLPSNGADFSGVGTEPVARITSSRSSSRLLPSAAVNSTLRPGSSWPCPCSAVTPAALNSDAMPPVMPLTIPALRFCMVATSSCSAPTPMPCTLNSCAAR